MPLSVFSSVEVSTATGDVIRYDSRLRIADIDGNARITSSTATITAERIRIFIDSKDGHALGNVRIEDSSGTLTGTEAFYNWQLSTGVVSQAQGISPPWRFSADNMRQGAPGVFYLEDGRITSCDAQPPHYWIRSRHGKWVSHKRVTLRSPFFHVDETPVFWLPIYSRSLEPKKYRLRIEPGNSGRDGLILRNTLGYPFSDNTYTRFKWDYFQRTGNGFGLIHQYNRADLRGTLDTYYVYDDNPDPAPRQRKYSVLWNHYHRMTQRLTGNARVNFVNNQSFVNDFGRTSAVQRRINADSGLLTEGGLTYQLPKASFNLGASRQDRYDEETGESFISYYTLPTLSFNTIPLLYKKVPFYTAFQGSFINRTQTATSADESLRIQRSASMGVNINRDVRLGRSTTLIPRAGFSETWQDRDFSKQDSKSDIYLGRYNTGIDVRQRFARNTDATASYLYAVRLEPNRLTTDINANDYGVETNRVNANVVHRIGWSNELRLSSGYDIRNSPRNAPDRFMHRLSRVTPPSLDVQWQLKPNVNLFFRETYGLYDHAAKRNRFTPINTSGEIQFGNPAAMTYFSQGFSYTKTPQGFDPQLNLTNRLKFFLTPKWYLDFSLSYIAVADQGMNYSKLKPNEKRLMAVRDMHCWLFRMEFLSNRGRNEASFYIDLKTNVATGRNVFGRDQESSFYQDIHRTDDLSTIFPEP